MMNFPVHNRLALPILALVPALIPGCARAQTALVAPAPNALLAQNVQLANPKAPRPNIVLIMADDMGFSDIGAYGGEIDTPNLDKLAAEGVRFQHFTNAARCCPTRASLITGLYPHQAGVGGMDSALGDLSQYQGELNNKCVTMAEVLKGAGYSTYMSGKWHLAATKHTGTNGNWEASTTSRAITSEDRVNWPIQRGFDGYYGIIGGAADYFRPNTLTLDNERLPQPKPDDNYYTTDGFTDYTVKTIEAQPKNKPFFFYVAYNAPHWPLQAKPADMAKYKGRFDKGWDVLRQERYERMKKIGLLDPKWELSPGEKAWEATENKPEMLRKMETYAAMLDSMDQGVGRIMGALKKSGQYHNTLVIFLSDNGACHESQGYGVPWANLSNTPFRMYKHWTHEGGMAAPMIAHWPGGIQAGRGWRKQLGDIKDFMATFVDVSGATYPQTFKGQPIPPMEGISLVPAFAGKSQTRAPLFWEHEGNRAVVEGDWKLVSASERGKDANWELYNLAQDRSEMHDLIKNQPARAGKMIAQWNIWEKRVGATTFPIAGGATDKSPQIAGKALHVSCEVKTNARSGVILAQGGAQVGYSLHLVDGKLIFSVREDGKLFAAIAPNVPTGQFKIQAQLAQNGAMTLLVNGKTVATGKAPGSISKQPLDGLDIGRDLEGSVGAYQGPNPLDGEVENVKIDAK